MMVLNINQMKDLSFAELISRTPYAAGASFDTNNVFAMNWTVYFIMAVSIASIAWGLVNFFIVNQVDLTDLEPIK